MMEKSYSLGLIILSVVVAAMGAYVAVEIAQRVRASEGRRRVFWTYGGAFAMGIGIWSMHFVGLLALRLPIPIWYDTLLIFASLIPAVAACAIAFFIFNRTTVNWWSLGIASLFMGAALAAMHYTGMAGMRMNGLASYEPVLIGVSAGISVVLSLAALILIRKVMDTAAERRRWLKKIGASLVLAAAVVGMHYAGLAAANFTRGLPDWRPTDDLVFATFQLGLVIAIISMALLILALFAAQFERSTIATRNRFENLLHLLPQVVWFGEPDGKISYCNPYWYEYTGLSEKQTLGDGWIDAIHPDDRERVVGSWRAAVREGNDYEVELRLRDKDGQYCWFLARSRSSRDESGKVNAWLGIAVDIEERKKAEEEAWAASQAKSEFLASMSHELRTPLNAIGGYAELLAMGVRGSLNAEQAQDIARIRRSQQHLLTLINDVLNFAKVDAGQAEYRLTAVPVDEALHDTESMIAPQILAKGLRYTYKGGDKTASVLADPEKLQQIVLNLLTNAVKFTDPGGSITLSAKPSGKCIDISVADTGAGIPQEKLDRIFDPFVQAERRLNQPVQGVGLGLAISRDLAQAMGGEITVESAVGKGSTFTLSLPRAPRMDLGDLPPATEKPKTDTSPAPNTEPTNSADRSLQEAPHT
ncbi:MAG: MHYT domain-containing protein [Gemmatimonadaceae bacterium]